MLIELHLVDNKVGFLVRHFRPFDVPIHLLSTDLLRFQVSVNRALHLSFHR